MPALVVKPEILEIIKSQESDDTALAITAICLLIIFLVFCVIACQDMVHLEEEEERIARWEKEWNKYMMARRCEEEAADNNE